MYQGFMWPTHWGCGGRPCRLGIVLLALLASCVAGVANPTDAAPSFLLDVAAGAGGRDVTLAARPGDTLALTLLRTTAGTETAELVLTPFIGDHGGLAEVRLAVDGKIVKAQPYKVKVSKPLTPLSLTVDKLPAAGKYMGSLVLMQAGKDTLVFKITLAPPPERSPALEVTPKNLVLSSGAGWGASGAKATFALTEKTKLWPAAEIAVRLDEASERFVSGRAKISVDGTPLNPAAPVSLGGLTIPAAATVPVKITVGGMPAGKHTATLRFLAAGAGDDAGKLGLTVEASHSIWWAVLALLIALAVSVGVTKLLGRLRERLLTSARIRGADSLWLAGMPSVLAVVWVRDILHEARTLNRAWFTTPPLIETRLSETKAVLDVLEQAYQVDQDIRRYQLPEFVRRRAVTALKSVVARLETTALSEPRAAQLRSDLVALASWTTTSKLAETYGNEVKGAIAALFCQINLDEIADIAARAAMEDLQEGIRADLDPVPTELDALLRVEEAYARLRLLWERRETGEFGWLVGLERDGDTLDALFTLADKAAWFRLRQTPLEIVVTRPTDPAGWTAWTPLVLSVVPADENLARTYLFLRGLQYEWTFALRSADGKKTILSPPENPSISQDPSTVVYADRAGTLMASVTLRYGLETLPSLGFEVNIGPSSDDTLVQKLARADVFSFAVAAIVAMASGLWLLYGKQPTFGSVQDYVGLMAWGVGVDQGKNLLQLLSSWSSSPAKPA
jgi:hypothetical protein